MTSKLSWVAFVPFAIAAVAIKIAQVLFITDATPTFMGLNSLELSYVAIGCVVAILLLSFILCITDKKIAPYYTMKRNIITGLFGALIAVMFAYDGANRLFSAFEVPNIDVMFVVDSILTLCTAIVFVVLCLSHIIGTNVSKGLSLFYLLPAIWSGFRLVSTFMKFTTVSIAVSDVSILAVYILLTLFLFNFASLIAFINSKSPIKATFVYGFSAAAMLIAYSANAVYTLVYSGVRFEILQNAETIEIALLGLYILTFLVELSIRSVKKDEVDIIYPENDDKNDDSKKKDKKKKKDKDDEPEFVMTKESKSDDNTNIGDTKMFTPISDKDLAKDTKTSDNGVKNKESSLVIDEEDEDYINMSNSVASQIPVESTGVFDTRMDEIDKLIFEISEEENK